MRRLLFGLAVLSFLLTACGEQEDLSSVGLVADLSITDGENSEHAERLIDGETGPTDAESWRPAGPHWEAGSYPVTAVLDLGRATDLKSLYYFIGNAPNPQSAGVTVAVKLTEEEDWQALATASPQGSWNRWRNVDLWGQARYVQLSFTSPSTFYNLSEVAVYGDPVTGEPLGNEPPTNEPPTENPPTGEPPTSPPVVPEGEHYSFGTANPPVGVPLSHGFGNWQPTQTGECSAEEHNRFWTIGPDGKVYHSWHPPKLSGGCTFGHEHGDNPWESAFYLNKVMTYQDLWASRSLPVPFGYASSVLAEAEPTGPRHEDHVGHKVYWERFEAAYGNGANPGQIKGSGITCDILLKPHQGVHSGDALANHLHEMVTHVACSDGSEAHVTLLSPLGRPGWFTNSCGNEGDVSGENNFPAVGNPIRSLPYTHADFGPVNSFPEGKLDGERDIPGAQCLVGYEADPPTEFNYQNVSELLPEDLKHYWGGYKFENWTYPVFVTDDSETSSPLFSFRPYVSVINPARVHSGGGSVPTTEACKTLEGTWGLSGACLKVISGDISASSPASPYNGTIRNVNFKGLHIYADGEFKTDAFGRQTDSSAAITQILKKGTADWWQQEPGVNMPSVGLAASLPTEGSNTVCARSGTNGFHETCNYTGGESFKFALEWWRDYRDESANIHAPN